MALLTAEEYLTLTQQSLTGEALSAAARWCASVSAAVSRAILPFVAEPVTIENDVHDAPPSRDLLIHRRPVRSITSVYYNPSANGLVANFTANDLIDNSDNQTYQLLIDDPIENISRCGILRHVAGAWGWDRIRFPDRLGWTLVNERGCLLLNYEAGLSAVPEDIQGACALAVSMLMNRKQFGMPVTSESWNGESISFAGPFTAIGAIQTPDVQAMLEPYLPGIRIGG